MLSFQPVNIKVVFTFDKTVEVSTFELRLIRVPIVEVVLLGKLVRVGIVEPITPRL